MVFDSGRLSRSLYEQAFPPLYIIDSIQFYWNSPYKDEDLLRQKYLAEGMNPRQIARLFFSSRQCIMKYLELYNIPIREEDRKLGPLSFGERRHYGRLTSHITENMNIEKVKSLREQGFSYQSIANIFNSLKIPTKSKKAIWYAKTIRSLVLRD